MPSTPPSRGSSLRNRHAVLSSTSLSRRPSLPRSSSSSHSGSSPISRRCVLNASVALVFLVQLLDWILVRLVAQLPSLRPPRRVFSQLAQFSIRRRPQLWCLHTKNVNNLRIEATISVINKKIPCTNSHLERGNRFTRY